MLVPETPSRCTGCSVHHLLIVVVLWTTVAMYFLSALTQVTAMKTQFEFVTEFKLCVLWEMRKIPWNSNIQGICWWLWCTGYPHAIHSTPTLFIICQLNIILRFSRNCMLSSTAVGHECSVRWIKNDRIKIYLLESHCNKF